MTDKELRKLKREELLEMLIEQGKKVESLEMHLQEAQKKLADREIRIDQAGNIAEASLQISGVFEAAQEAARQYLENIQRLSERQEEVCEVLLKETQAKCREMERKTEEKCHEMEVKTEAKCCAMRTETEDSCRAMRQEAQQETDKRWSELEARLESYYDAHKGLRELLDAMGGVKLE